MHSYPRIFPPRRSSFWELSQRSAHKKSLCDEYRRMHNHGRQYSKKRLCIHISRILHMLKLYSIVNNLIINFLQWIQLDIIKYGNFSSTTWSFSFFFVVILLCFNLMYLKKRKETVHRLISTIKLMISNNYFQWFNSIESING